MLDFLLGKKIAIVGMGVNNQKLAEYFDKHKIKYEVVKDWKLNSDLVGRLDSFDIVFRTPGLPYLSPAIQQAKSKGVQISSQTKLFFDLCPCPIIGITGTKGKGTTSTLITKILEAGDYKVWLGGNIGVDPFEFLDFIHPQDIAVLELSSYQLQDLHKSPHIAVVLNITADHLDESGTYEKKEHASLKEYFDAKMQILSFQSENDFAIISHELPATVGEIGNGEKIIFDPKNVLDFQHQLLGAHNLENIAAATAVARVLEVPEEKIRNTVAQFAGLPHRMQIIGDKNGVTYIDDSFATDEIAAVCAIEAIPNPLIVILGGSSKGLEYWTLGEVVKRQPNLKAAIVIGQESPKILKAIEGFTGQILTGAKNMPEIIAQVKNIATSGDTVLLSPAAASFDMFQNATDRGEQFAREALA